MSKKQKCNSAEPKKTKKVTKSKKTKKKANIYSCEDCNFFRPVSQMLPDFCRFHCEIRKVLIRKKVLPSLDSICNKFCEKTGY